MAKNVSEVKKTSSGSGKLIKKVASVLLSVLIIAFSFIYLNNVDKSARDTVSVVRIKSTDLPAYTAISENDIEKYDIIKKEFDGADGGMILFDEVSNIYGLLTAYYIRGGTFLYKNQLIEEKPQRNEWLYELPDDYEVVTIPYDYMEAGGDILLPGDTIKIRVTYELEETADEEFVYADESTFSTEGKLMKTEVIFDSIIVTDMINSKAQSIYEIYNEVTKLSEATRQEVMKSAEFIASIKPKALVLSGTPDQMDMYAKFKATVGTGNFLITILTRSNSYVILDQLPTLESEVQTWLKE
ncbi:MAG: flagellar biosynthesis protein FlgA [Clostridiales bacterium]|jgi:hypothetical protein|nr:flagellar biosynthesis protein FlgA [Clostridiales bacterium]